jgi:hypothetical protein
MLQAHTKGSPEDIQECLKAYKKRMEKSTTVSWKYFEGDML